MTLKRVAKWAIVILAALGIPYALLLLLVTLHDPPYGLIALGIPGRVARTLIVLVTFVMPIMGVWLLRRGRMYAGFLALAPLWALGLVLTTAIIQSLWSEISIRMCDASRVIDTPEKAVAIAEKMSPRWRTSPCPS